MTHNPFINALCASLYIALLVSGIFYGSTYFESGPDTVLIPIAMLSLFVFSAATMGYLFLYQPLMLLSEGKKQEAASFFLRTLLMFGVTTGALMLIVLFLMRSF